LEKSISLEKDKKEEPTQLYTNETVRSENGFFEGNHSNGNGNGDIIEDGNGNGDIIEDGNGNGEDN
jgi:hypothetical protein